MGAQDADELWQAYDEQGRVLPGRGLTKPEAYSGLLHGAAHVWVWRFAANGAIEVLLQMRAPGKRAWPERLDTSAAGHINFGEEPLTAALREMREEIALGATGNDMHFGGIHRCYMTANDGFIENEVRFIYILQMPADAIVGLSDGEVSSVVWKPLDVFTQEALHDASDIYVPHGTAYIELVAENIRLQARLATRR